MRIRYPSLGPVSVSSHRLEMLRRGIGTRREQMGSILRKDVDEYGRAFGLDSQELREAAGVSAEAITYATRVRNDGGQVYSLTAIDAAFTDLSAMGITSGLVVANRFGRKVTSGRTEKLYNLFESALDLIQLTSANAPADLDYANSNYVYHPGVGAGNTITRNSDSVEITGGVAGNYLTGCTVISQTSVSLAGETYTIARNATGLKIAIVDRPMSLYGTDRFMEVADNPLLDFGASDTFSVAAGLRVHSAQPASFSGIISKRNSASTTASDTGWVLRMGTDTPVSVVEGGGSVSFLGGTAAAYGNIRLIGMTRGGGVLGSSTNGTLTTTADATGDLSNVNSVRFGRLAGASTNYVDMESTGGAIPRQALTSAQFTTLRTLLGADE